MEEMNTENSENTKEMKCTCTACGTHKSMHHEHDLHLEGNEAKCNTCAFTNPAPTCDGCQAVMKLVQEAQDNAQTSE